MHLIYVKLRSISDQIYLDVIDSFFALTIGFEFSDRPNMHSQIFKPGIGIDQLLKNGANQVPQAELVFENLHGKNKRLKRKLFVDELLDRMGLESDDV